MTQNTFVPSYPVGSTDWTGGTAPAGGTHTGTATLVMRDGVRISVASNAAEVRRKLDVHAVAPVSPQWVAFDVPGSTVPVVVDVSQVLAVS